MSQALDCSGTRCDSCPCRHVVPAAFDAPVGGPFPNVLSADEGGPPSRAALLAVAVGEPGALVGDPVDVGRPVPHQAVAVAAQVIPMSSPQMTRMLGRSLAIVGLRI